MNDLTPFDEITAKLPQLSAFQTLWNEAEELLRETHPEGYEVEEIGRIAFDCLPDEEKPAALDALFYCWWEVEQDRNPSALIAELRRLRAELYTEQVQHRTTLEQRNAHAKELLQLRARIAQAGGAA